MGMRSGMSPATGGLRRGMPSLVTDLDGRSWAEQSVKRHVEAAYGMKERTLTDMCGMQDLAKCERSTIIQAWTINYERIPPKNAIIFDSHPHAPFTDPRSSSIVSHRLRQ